MPRIAVGTLNASTLDILNVIRHNASYEYQSQVPVITQANWRVMYPVTIQDEDLKQAFLPIDGVQDMIAKIVDSVYTAAEQDLIAKIVDSVYTAAENDREWRQKYKDRFFNNDPEPDPEAVSF